MTWYVNDLKVSHNDQSVVDEIIKKINDRFGGLITTNGKEHTYLGMKIKYNDDRTVSINMSEYIEETIDVFSEVSKISPGATTPAKQNLFDVDEDSKRLDTKRSNLFHHCTANLLYVSKRCRLDIALTISFLCSRVSCSSEEDWLKLKRLLRYLYRTKEPILTIGGDNMSVVGVFVDSLYAVHPNMVSHIGACISFGRVPLL